jgi:hypothetical protein
MNKRSLNLPYFYPYSLLVFLALGFASSANAAGGFWQVEGQLINIDSSGINVRECSQSNTTLRFRSRWSNGQGCIAGTEGECPWGVWWGMTTTNASGRFNKTSPFLIELARKRDVQVQYRAQGVEWRTIAVVSDVSGASPHQQNGNVWSFDLGLLKTNAFQCPTILVPGRQNNAPALQPVADPNPDNGPKIKAVGKNGPVNESTTATPSVKILEIPCGMEHRNNINYDLAFESTAVRHRDNKPDAPIERITWEVVIRNHGTVTYQSSGKCRTIVRMSVYIPELNATRVYEITLRGSIGPGQSRKFTSNSGNLGEISEASSISYNLKFEIDPENKVMELDEANNIQPGCYTPSNGNYVDNVCG